MRSFKAQMLNNFKPFSSWSVGQNLPENHAKCLHHSQCKRSNHPLTKSLLDPVSPLPAKPHKPSLPYSRSWLICWGYTAMSNTKPLCNLNLTLSILSETVSYKEPAALQAAAAVSRNIKATAQLQCWLSAMATSFRCITPWQSHLTSDTARSPTTFFFIV